MKAWIAALAMTVASLACAGPGDGDLVSLLKGTETRQQLSISQDILSKIDEVLATMEKKIDEAVNKARPSIKVGGFNVGKAPDPFNVSEKLRSEFRVQIAKMLNPDQLQQALKLGIKAEGNFAFLMPDVAKEIKLDKGIKGSIEKFRNEYFDLRKDLDGKVKKGDLTAVERAAQLAARDTELQEKIAKLVPAELIDKLKSLSN
ncbi:MAG TPA: hypothetical protein VK171_14485 [Fimbriimonas sp.]|nr:hypothetical protein [Fimbriimonas sp.]